MPTVIKIDPHAIYTEGAVALALDIPLSAIGRARRQGELRFVRRGRQVLITGGNLLDWLTPSPALAPRPHAPATPTPAH